MKLAVALIAALAFAAPAAAAAPHWKVTITGTRLVQWEVSQNTSCTSETGAGQEYTTYSTPKGATIGLAGLRHPAGSGLTVVVKALRDGELTATPNGTCTSGCTPPVWNQFTTSPALDRCDLTAIAPERSCGAQKQTIPDGHGFVLALKSGSTLEVALDPVKALFPKGCPGYGDSATQTRGIFGSPTLKLSTLLAHRTVRLHGAYSGELCSNGKTGCTATAGVKTKASWTVTFTRVG
jgi:hypothetical protein